jgi:hypothetical protein
MVLTTSEDWSAGFAIKTKDLSTGPVLCVPVFFDSKMFNQVLVTGKSMRLIR